MFAVIELGGVQHIIKKGDVITVNHLDEDINKEIVIDKVLSLSDGKSTKIGTPTVEGAKVKAEVVEHLKDKKVIIFKKIRRHNHRRKNGFRQSITKLKITDIN